ncbi:MAG: alpha/beta hydrolase fold domain-containing protein [Nocardioides sp.]|uniref:alpha/beta hydrolase fold domain-containing protein n=1 Tax=Nocardioides sp. TaxID=35761 RepID=UPI003F0CE6A5
MTYLARQILNAALTTVVSRPVQRSVRSAIGSFATGWLPSELSPQMLALTATDTAVHLARPRGGKRSKLGVALALGTMAVHASRVRAATRSGEVIEAALKDSLTPGHTTALGDLGPVDRSFPRKEALRPFNFKNPGVHVERNIAYSECGKRGMLDIYRPADHADLTNAPVLLQVHGGAWILGQKEQQGLPLMNELASQGWVCVAINYRLAPRDPWPAHIIDVKRAIAWIKQHISEYGGDPDYLVITGGSAGGHLTALAALTPNAPEFQPGFEDEDTSVQLAVPHYGVYDLAGSTGLESARLMRDGFLSSKVMMTTWEENPEVFEAASPILRITEDAPDFFVLHGDKDSLVDVNQGRVFVERLREVSKNSVSYAEFPGAQHAYEIFNSIRSGYVTRGVSRYIRAHHAAWKAGRPAPEVAVKAG